MQENGNRENKILTFQENKWLAVDPSTLVWIKKVQHSSDWQGEHPRSGKLQIPNYSSKKESHTIRQLQSELTNIGDTTMKFGSCPNEGTMSINMKKAEPRNYNIWEGLNRVSPPTFIKHRRRSESRPLNNFLFLTQLLPNCQ